MTLPNNLILEKNKSYNPDPWIALLKITLNDLTSTTFRLARNPEDIYFDDCSGNGIESYDAFPFELDPRSLTSKGEIPVLTIKVCNITRLIQPYLETLNGGIGSTVKVMIVHCDHKTRIVTGSVANYADLIQYYTILTCASDSKWISLTLGGVSPLRRPFPLYRYVALYCRWQFDTSVNPSPECGYRTYGDGTGKTTCKRTWEDCKAHANTERFGGFIGLQTGGLRIV